MIARSPLRREHGNVIMSSFWNRSFTALATTAVLSVTLDAAVAEVPATIGFTARLADDAGQPLAGPRELSIALFTAATGGEPRWQEDHEVTAAADGMVNLALGGSRPLSAEVLAGGPLFLELSVGGVVLSPRLAVASVPYALRAAVAERLAPGGELRVDRVLEGGLGGSRHQPATSCAALHQQRPELPSGVYWLAPSSAPAAFEAYCDMETDGGGWTLVWSNLRGGRGKPATELQWGPAIHTLPRVSGQLSADLESFVVYTGLAHWVPMAPAFQLRYSWANDYGSEIDQSYRCTFNLTTATYVLSFNTSTCEQLVGDVVPGLVVTSNGKAFSTYDADHDDRPDSAEGCAQLYTNSPWWYANCWSGSINGGGELSVSGANVGQHFNGAYWVAAVAAWGTDNGQGAGNGWIFVR
jgi:hypothetical protein